MENTNHDLGKKQRNRLSTLLFILAILLGLIIRFKLNAGKILLEYDDAISVLVATGHEGEYAQISSAGDYPIGSWVPAREWQRLVDPEPGRGLYQVAADLAAYDIHPPLYFWALYGWALVFGTSLPVLQAFNLFLELLILGTLVWVGRQVFGSLSAGLLLGATWFLSPIAIKTAFWIRQYTFFGLVLLVFFYLLFCYANRPNPTRLLSLQALWLALAVLAGVFTHYYFFFFLAAGLALAVFPALQHSKRRMVYMSTALLGGLAFLFLTYPGFSQSLVNYLDKFAHLYRDPTELSERVRNAAKTLTLLYSPAMLGLGLVVLGMWPGWGKERGGWAAAIKDLFSGYLRHPLGPWAAAFAVLPLLAMLVLYLLGLSPGHAFSSRYLGFLSPLVAFIPVLFIFLSIQPGKLVPFFYAGLFALGLATLLPGLTQSQEGWVDRADLLSARYVLIDSIQWGTWPGIVQYLDDRQEVFSSGQEQLLADPQAWLSRPDREGFIYISIVRGMENTDAGRDQILALLNRHYLVEELSEAYRPQDWSVRLYRVQPVP